LSSRRARRYRGGKVLGEQLGGVGCVVLVRGQPGRHRVFTKACSPRHAISTTQRVRHATPSVPHRQSPRCTPPPLLRTGEAPLRKLREGRWGGAPVAQRLGLQVILGAREVEPHRLRGRLCTRAPRIPRQASRVRQFLSRDGRRTALAPLEWHRAQRTGGSGRLGLLRLLGLLVALHSRVLANLCCFVIARLGFREIA
jgi:hypothetical protein